jgi:hypothetical protein
MHDQGWDVQELKLLAEILVAVRVQHDATRHSQPVPNAVYFGRTKVRLHQGERTAWFGQAGKQGDCQEVPASLSCICAGIAKPTERIIQPRDLLTIETRANGLREPAKNVATARRQRAEEHHPQTGGWYP